MRYDIVPLQNLCEMITRGITPRYIEDGTGLVVINQKCIRDNRVSLDAARRHNVSEKPVMEGRKIRCHDILVNSTGTGTLGRVGQVKAQNIVATVDSHVTIVRPNPVIVDPTYLGYALIWKQPDIEALAEGSTGQTELSRTRLGEEITVPVPPLAIQKKAASILSSLDARIDVNRQLNDNFAA